MLTKVLLEETGGEAVCDLPVVASDTSVVVDAMHMIQRWSVLPGETFDDVQKCPQIKSSY